MCFYLIHVHFIENLLTYRTDPPKLVVLNSLISFDETAPLPPQKAMFLLRNVLTWFNLDEAPEDDTSDTVNEALVSESAKLLRTLVPIIKDVYGSHWSALCKFVLFGLKVCLLVHKHIVSANLIFAELISNIAYDILEH